MAEFTTIEYVVFGGGLGVALLFAVLFFYFIQVISKSSSKNVQKTVKQESEVVPVVSIQKTLSPKLKPAYELPSIEEDSFEDYHDAKGFNVLKDNKSKWTFKYWKDWYVDRAHPASTALVNMELLNGFHKLFLVKEKDGGFKYKGKKYLFDNEAKYYLIDSKLWAYDYHETFSLPIKRVLPVTKIRKTMEATGISEVEYATNPKTLEQFAVSKIAEGIMRGAELDAVFKFLKLMIIIILVVVVIHFLLYAQKSGIFDQVSSIV